MASLSTWHNCYITTFTLGITDYPQEDVNGEKRTVKKWWIFGADFFTVYADFSRFIRDIDGEKKHLVIDDLFHG